jgi:hypothetical protein
MYVVLSRKDVIPVNQHSFFLLFPTFFYVLMVGVDGYFSTFYS